MQALSSFNPEVSEYDNEKSWVRQYVVRDVLRAIEEEDEKTNKHQDISELLDIDDIDELIDYALPERMSNQVDFHKALKKLPEPEQSICIMHFMDDMSYTDIAYAKSLNKQAVYRIVTKGINLIKEDIL